MGKTEFFFIASNLITAVIAGRMSFLHGNSLGLLEGLRKMDKEKTDLPLYK